MNENLEAVRMSRELEQPEYTHYRDELVEVRVRHALFIVGYCENEVEVERKRSDKVDYVHGRFNEVEFHRTHKKSE